MAASISRNASRLSEFSDGLHSDRAAPGGKSIGVRFDFLRELRASFFLNRPQPRAEAPVALPVSGKMTKTFYKGVPGNFLRRYSAECGSCEAHYRIASVSPKKPDA